MKTIIDLPKDIQKLGKELKAKKKQLLRNVGVIAANHFQNNITEGKDINGNAMVKRNPEFMNRQGRGLLIKSSKLRRSIRTRSISNDTVVIATKKPYAQIHNEGGQIDITPKMRRFFWAKYYEARGKIKTNKAGTATNLNSRNVGRSRDARTWRNLALKKTPIEIKKRQFMGIGNELDKLIQKEVQDTFKDLGSSIT
jgi:phage gpG-like protein